MLTMRRAKLFPHLSRERDTNGQTTAAYVHERL
jgi:hypothetical protein